MHEASLMLEVLNSAVEVMRRDGGTKIHWLRLRVGEFSGVVPEAMRFAFDALKEGTPAADAMLHIDWVPLRLACTACGVEFASEGCPDLCPECGSAQTEVTQGSELDLVSLEISQEG